MLNHAYSGSVQIGNSRIDYVSFGHGNRNLVMLPGLGEALSSLKGMAPVFSILYRRYARDFTVYVFGRKNPLCEPCSTRQMAKDQAQAMRKLRISQADVLGVSQGGMIAQYLAIDFPHLVRRLVLTVSSPGPNETLKTVISSWVQMARQENYKGLMTDITEKSYSPRRLKKYRLVYPLLGLTGKPKDFKRFLIQAAACIEHNAWNELDKIQCPTLIIGGDCDKIVGPESSSALSESIQDSHLLMYHGLGHGLYEEARDFHQLVLDFLTDQ